MRINYPPADSNGVVNYKNANPVKIYWTLPDYLYVNKQDRVRAVLWDHNTQEWSDQYVDNLEFDHKTKQMTVSVLTIAPMAYYVPKNIDFPYKHFKIRCKSDEVAILDVQTRRMNMRFEITSGYVYLRDRTEPELQHLVDEPFEPSDLLFELQRCGINLLPEDEDAA